MLDKKDAQWWVLEAQKRPDAAVDLIRVLADRLAFLDKQNEELRGQLIALQRKGRGESGGAEADALRRRIQELEGALRQTGIEQRLIIYASDRIEANLSLKAAVADGLGREISPDVALLLCTLTTRLLIVTSDSRLFAITLADLPTPQPDGPAALGNPRQIAAILDQSVLDQSRFLILVSRSGHIYSVLAGTVNQVSRRQDKLIRAMIPDDPIVAALPSYNADIFAISQKGRWTRFAENAIAGTGSQVMDLPKGDVLAGVLPLRANCSLVFLTADGKLYVRPSADLSARRAPGTSAGMLFKGQTILGVVTGSELVVLTQQGKILTTSLEGLPFKAQTETGAPLPGLADHDSILAFATR